MIKHLIISSPSVLAKFVFLTLVSYYKMVDLPGFLIYALGLTQIIISLFSQILLVPYAEAALKMRFFWLYQIAAYLLGLIVIILVLIPTGQNMICVAITVYSLMLNAELVKKTFVRKPRLQFISEALVFVSYLVLFIAIRSVMVIVLLFILSLMGSLILGRLQYGDVVKPTRVFGYNWSGLPLIIISFLASNILLVVLSHLVEVELFDELNVYRLWFAPVGVIVGVMENKLLTQPYRLITTSSYQLIIGVLLFASILVDNVFFFIMSGLLLAILQAAVRLNNILLRRRYMQQYVFHLALYNMIASIVISSVIMGLTSNIYMLYLGNILSLLWINWMIERRIGELN